VIGVARKRNSEELKRHGAHLVVEDLGGLVRQLTIVQFIMVLSVESKTIARNVPWPNRSFPQCRKIM
jgi:hypothetical protein